MKPGQRELLYPIPLHELATHKSIRPILATAPKITSVMAGRMPFPLTTGRGVLLTLPAVRQLFTATLSEHGVEPLYSLGMVVLPALSGTSSTPRAPTQQVLSPYQEMACERLRETQNYLRFRSRTPDEMFGAYLFAQGTLLVPTKTVCRRYAYGKTLRDFGTGKQEYAYFTRLPDSKKDLDCAIEDSYEQERLASVVLATATRELSLCNSVLPAFAYQHILGPVRPSRLKDGTLL